MNIKNKRILALIGVGFIAALTTAPTLKDLNASLTTPASYNFGYFYSGSVQQYVSSNGSSPTSIALFTRTTDGAYYNYSHTFSNSASHSNISNYDLPDGIDITMTFYRSNTSWTNASPTYTGYYPTQNKIGSDATVGTLTKEYLKFDNQTSKDYYLYLDKSSNAGFLNYEFLLNGKEFVNTSSGLYMHVVTSLFMRLVIPSYSTFEMRASSIISAALYLDAWYLQDLGVSDSFDAGYVAGQDDADLLVTGFSAMVGILVNFVLMIANLEVLGVSLMGILTIIILFAGIVWTLKLVRG